MTYDTSNGVKPRYDGGGSEFGSMHRDLGPGMYMFDIDRLSGNMSTDIDFELRRENEGFVEYRIKSQVVKFVALFEIKAHKTKHALEALDSSNANSRARSAMAQMLKCRLFVVYATNGKQPFEFYEINTETGEAQSLGALSYDVESRQNECQRFWRDVLGIARSF